MFENQPKTSPLFWGWHGFLCFKGWFGEYERKEPALVEEPAPGVRIHNTTQSKVVLSRLKVGK